LLRWLRPPARKGIRPYFYNPGSLTGHWDKMIHW